MGRPATLSLKELRRDARSDPGKETAEDYAELELERPRTRADCINGPRPCPFVSCKYHLFLDITPAGSLHLNHPDKEPDQLEHTCALDLADDGEKTLEQVGEVMGVTRERIRQIETLALDAVRQASKEEED